MTFGQPALKGHTGRRGSIRIWPTVRAGDPFNTATHPRWEVEGPNGRVVVVQALVPRQAERRAARELGCLDHEAVALSVESGKDREQRRVKKRERLGAQREEFEILVDDSDEKGDEGNVL